VVLLLRKPGDRDGPDHADVAHDHRERPAVRRELALVEQEALGERTARGHAHVVRGVPEPPHDAVLALDPGPRWAARCSTAMNRRNGEAASPVGETVAPVRGTVRQHGPRTGVTPIVERNAAD
jgi:hypothetical protein